MRREIADLPDELHELGGQQKSRYAKEEDLMERLEQDNMKRIQFTKKEMKERKRDCERSIETEKDGERQTERQRK